MTAEHWDCTNEEYHASDGVSNSRLSDFIADPAYYHAKHVARTYVDPPKDCYKIGTIVHDRTLLGVFDGSVILIPEDALNADGHRKGADWKAFAEENADKHLLNQAEWDKVRRYCDAVDANPTAKQIIDESKREHSIRWVDDETGLLCRCRLDCLHPRLNADIKTTRDNTRAGFANAAFRYGYHRQAHFYSEGSVRYREGKEVPFLFLAVTEWSCRVYRLMEPFPEMAANEVRTALKRLSECMESGMWSEPWDTDVIDLGPPRWAFTNQQYELEEV